MANTKAIVVTAATGNIGSKLVKKLLLKGQQVRAVARNKAKLQALADAGAEIFEADVLDPAAMTKAFSGAKAVFTLIPPLINTPDIRAYYNGVSQSYATGLKEAGVTHVVNLSSIGGHLKEKTGPILGLHDHEQRLNAITTLRVLHLRPAFFMENLLMQVDLIKNMGILGFPLRADLKFPMIATQDISDAADEQLERADFSGHQAKELLGQRDVTMNEVTTAIGKAIGKPDLKYVQFPYEDAKKAMMGMGLSDSFASSLVEMDRSMNDGLVGGTEPRSATNTTPTSIEEFATHVFAPAFHQQKEKAGVR